MHMCLRFDSLIFNKAASNGNEMGGCRGRLPLSFFNFPTPFIFLLISFHLLTTQLTEQIVPLIQLGDNLVTTLPHIIPFSYRQRNMGSVRLSIRDSCWTMGSTPSHMATKINQWRWRVYGRVPNVSYVDGWGKEQGSASLSPSRSQHGTTPRAKDVILEGTKQDRPRQCTEGNLGVHERRGPSNNEWGQWWNFWGRDPSKHKRIWAITRRHPKAWSWSKSTHQPSAHLIQQVRPHWLVSKLRNPSNPLPSPSMSPTCDSDPFDSDDDSLSSDDSIF